MNWLFKSQLYLLLQLVHHVSTLETVDHISVDFSTEVPKPIPAMDFEKLDAAYKQPRKLKTWQTEKSKKPTMVDLALQVAAREGINAMTELYQNIEPEIVKNGQILEDNHPAALLSKFSAPVEGTERSAMAAFATLSATKAFRRNNKESTVLGRQAQSQKVSFRRTPLEGLCPARDPPTCMPASQRYRTHDGTCNNRRRLRWGSAQMPFNRFLPPEYGDGVESIRGSVEGGSLSSARFVSLLVHGAREGEAPLTQMLVQWGQLLDHDLTSTAQPRSINGSVPSCCGSKDFHPSCFPIKVPLDDPWLAPLKVRCLEFLRSAPAQRRDCVLSWREQTNQVTSYIDASPIYSSNAKTSDNARIFRNGLLIYGRGDPADDVCMRGAIAHQCIRSGDGRSGEQPGLLALHHVWVGEHNRIAMELSILNPHWSDEKVYQETRRIIGALFQHITYREFLPIVLGREVCKLFDLNLVITGFYSGYDPNTNPTVSNAFAAAAFRFGHSLVQNSYMRCDRNHNFINNNVTLHEEFQQGDIGTAGSLHRLLRGLATQKALKRDEFITPELTNHLFQTPGFPFGLDLAAINIQRGRDHGIAPYTAWRQPCGLSSIDTWDDLKNIVGPESAKRISHAYRNVHDIDLFVGGIAERPVIGGLVGPTFACIIAQQFSNSRKGDRFWYENSGFESSFTPAQLNSLRHVSLSSVLCRAINGGTLQPHVFIPNDVKGNQRVRCGKDPLEPIDLRPWLEQDPFLMSNGNNDQPLPQNPSLPSPISTQPTKEEKGISNRIQNVTMVTNVDFIPNSSIGFHRVPNMTKIHDKLDMAQKLVTRPVVQPIRGINNKLDKNRLTVKNKQKPTVSSLSKRISTTRRTVVIHNVEIELRSASGALKEQKNKKKKTSFSPDSIASTAQNTILKVAGVVKSQLSAAMGFLTDNDNAETKHSSRKMNDQSATLNMTDLTNNEHMDWSNKTDAEDDNSTITGRHLSKNGETDEETPILATMTKPLNKQTKESNQKDSEDTTIDSTSENIKDKVNVQNTISTEELNQTSDYKITTNEPLDTSETQNFSPSGQHVNTDAEDEDNDQGQSKNKNLTNIEIQKITESDTLDNAQDRQDISPNNTKQGNKDESISKYVTNEQNNVNLTILSNVNSTSGVPLLIDNNSEQFGNNFNSNEHETEPSDNPRDSHDTYKDFQAIIDSALQDPLDELKRVHRKSDHNIVQVKKVELHTNLEFEDKLRTLRSDKTKEFTGRQLIDPKEKKTAEMELNQKLDEKDFTEPTLSITTEQPATLRNVEHRQFQERPIYNRPQKLILDAPHTDQYEIEINIRQTNTKPPKTNANYEDYNSPHKRYDTDRYDQHFEYTDGHNTPSSNYHTKTTRAPYGTRTKPPTIIYIDEHEHDDHITTRNPGFFQNIISLASNGLNGIRQQTTTTTSPFHQNPNRISNSGSDHYSSSHSSRPYQHSNPSSSNYLNAQPPQPFPPNQGFPQHGFSQGPPNFNPAGRPQPVFPPPNIYPPQALPGANSFSTASSINGVSHAHASSSAVSTGHFGAIAGSAASSGGDSTFSFNIRPSPRPQLNLVTPTGIKPDYELLPQRRPQYPSTPNYAIPPKPMPSVESFQYPPNKHDPFSSYTRRPPSYYDKIPNNVFDPAYDDIGRSDLKIQDGFDLNQKSNHTDDENFDSDDYDYNDDDNTFSNILNNDNVVEERESNKDDKLEDSKRQNPALTKGTKLNMTELDDNFVLPALRENNDFVQPEKDDQNLEELTSFPTVEQKSLSQEIFAEEYDELLTARSAFLDSQESAIKSFRNKVKKPNVNEPVAFAPIQILTKPERPDNWVIYDTPDEKPLLPVQPEYNTETLVAAEVPMPFQRRIKNRISTSRQTTTTNDNEETATFDIKTSETDAITNQPIISQDDSTNPLDLTKDKNDKIEVKTTKLEHK